MGDVSNKENLFQRRQIRVKHERKAGLLLVDERPAAAVIVYYISPEVMRIQQPTEEVKRVPIQVPVTSERATVTANFERLSFNLENIIANLKKESDGSSRRIPELNEFLESMRVLVLRLKQC